MNVDDMSLWEKSEAYLEYLGFITAMNEEVKGKPSRGTYEKSANVDVVINILNKLDDWTTEIPPIEQPQRFGNKAFRTWYEKLKNDAGDMLMDSMDPKFHQAIAEFKYYLIESFGNSTRIDYGTGHEMSFCMFLCCMFKVGAFVASDKAAVVCYIFSRYLAVVRRLQTVYKMEPAGSRGVWALDDFQFVPFIWGSSQLIGHPRIMPSMFIQEDVMNTYSDDFMFIACIKFISQVKFGPFAEHSNQLWNISGVQSWEKINTGLIRMYKAEVLGQFPVIQHVLFGSLLRFKMAEIRSEFPNRPSPVQTLSSSESLERVASDSGQ
ncbi:hypothetical protein AAG570_001328 [Ranatra chinensis]|uniref:Serine/threonine-protein phosphatase 2A activator n=1 Tax=Ranatra chinensis TaxID=642074 RepID=A0ABD0YC96_9HEMI